MKRIKKIGVLLLSIFILGAAIPHEAYAASAKVTVTSATGNVGKSVTVTCTATMSGTDIGSADVTIEYEPSVLSLTSCSSGASGNSGGVFFSQNASSAGTKSLSFTMTFKILKEGIHSLKVAYADISDWETGESVVVSTSGATIKGKVATTSDSSSNNNSNSNSSSSNNRPTQDTRDKNANLSSLQVYPGTLSPAFNSGTTSYTVTVPGETTEVTISATPESSKAKVSVSGGTNLKLGENAAKVVVMAENDSTKVYNIKIICGEEEKIEVGGTENKINESFTDDQIPAGFSRTKVTYNGREYKALTNESGTLKLMSLQSGETAKFYIYNQDTQTFLDFVPALIATGKYIYLMPLNETNEEFANHEKTQVTILEKVFDAWKLNEEFSVITALNQNGEEVLYCYDSVDGTFQRHVEIEEKEEEPVDEVSMFPNEYYLYAIISLGALVMILLIALIYFIATRRIRHEARKNRAQKKAEKAAAKAEKNQKEE